MNTVGFRKEDDVSLKIICGDSLTILPTLPADSIDSCVTDPPYELTGKSGNGGFMGKKWDSTGIAFNVDLWREVLRVLKPGAHLLAFGGTRTYHRMACAIEDAGFEIRDSIVHWIHAQGFPKSADISKQLDLQEQAKWQRVIAQLDQLDQSEVLASWIEFSNNVRSAEPSFLSSNAKGQRITPVGDSVPSDVPTSALKDASPKTIPNGFGSVKFVELTSLKSLIATGISTPRSDTALAPVLLRLGPESLYAPVILAELSLNDRHLRPEAAETIAHMLAEGNRKPDLVKSAASPPQNDRAKHTHIGIVQCSVKEWQSGKTAEIIRAAEALKIWLGSKPSSKRQAIAALCAALTDDLKRITLNPSKTFQSLDMTQQTVFVSATSVTITESTAASLISFTVDTLRREAIDKAAGAERKIVGRDPHYSPGRKRTFGDGNKYGTAQGGDEETAWLTAPATPAAIEWQGWGTALKPSHEPIVLARKPLSESTIAANVLRWGTGALNVDGCRVATEDGVAAWSYPKGAGGHRFKFDPAINRDGPKMAPPAGRFPPNTLFSHLDSCQDDTCADGCAVAELGRQSGERHSGGCEHPRSMKQQAVYGSRWTTDRNTTRPPDTGTAARFFPCFRYQGKASRRDRGEGNTHSTVKPTALMEWLVRLVTPPGGTVLDPFAGSGTTLVACQREGFSCIGIEIETESCEIAARRLGQESFNFEAVSS